MAKAEKTIYPAYITEGGDGSLTVDLSRGFEVAGVKTFSVTLREPSLEDQLASQKIGTNADAEVALIANLAELAPEELRGVKMRDFLRLQEALGFFYA